MPFDEIVSQMFGGPGHLRFFIQPTVALLLGVRDGRRDDAAGRAPYVVAVLTAADRQARRVLLREALHAIAKALTVAIVVDLVLQYMIFGSIRLWLAVAVGTVLITLPYTLARGLSNRIPGRTGRTPQPRTQRGGGGLRTDPPAAPRCSRRAG